MKRAIHNGIKTAMVAILLLNTDACFAQFKRYPYVQDSTTIVCREGNDGVKSSLIHPIWTSTQTGGETNNTHNLVARRFNVEAHDNDGDFTWQEAVSACPAPWRLPTVREMGLIVMFNDDLLIKLDEKKRYWCATSDGKATVEMAYAARYVWHGWGLEMRSATESNRVRCIRDF